jgi:sugar/nucleoside kinase (ribokinase family)
VSAQPPLVCFGNLTLDDLVPCDAPPRAHCIGGDALYGVLAARFFEPHAEMVAPVGCDFPADIRARIDRAGLSADGLPQRTCPSIRTRIIYRTPDDRTVTLLSDPADFDRLSPSPCDVPEPYWQARAFMILAMTLDAQNALLTACRARTNSLIALDPQEEYIAGNEAAVLNIAARADIFMPSLAEVKLLLRHDNAPQAARFFAAQGPRIVVIKMGAEGCLVYDARSGRMFIQPGFPARPVDTTGSGDAFCSAFMASLVRSPDSLTDAAARGTVAASFALSDYGAEGLFGVARERVEERCGAILAHRWVE